MSTSQNALLVLLAYYVVQILYVHHHTLKLHNIAPTPAQNNETIIVKRTEIVHQTRDHLTQEQLSRIRKSVEESMDISGIQDELSAYSGKIATEIQTDLEKIKDLSSNIKAVVDANPIPDAPQNEATNDEDKETIPFADLPSFLTKTSFAGYTDAELASILPSVVDAFSSLGHYNINLDALPKSSSDGTKTCNAFLTRTVAASRKKKYATKQALVSFLDSVRFIIGSITAEPLSDEIKELISKEFSSETSAKFDAVQTKVDSWVQDLKDFAEENKIVNDSLESENTECIEQDEVHILLDQGIAAHNEKESVYDALAELVDDLDETIMNQPDSPYPEEDVDEPLTLKDLLSFPLYSKLIDKVDSTVDFIGGYNDAIDRLIDAIGGNEDGGVGKNLEKILNRLALKVEVPKEYNELKLKSGVTK
mmetsp:Transcript_5619/g.8566  ORF Transcript_5619/g.8566 Transcript_5619/m.8566 type:complete len:422 (-) Transcript_5619:25-1290(-)